MKLILGLIIFCLNVVVFANDIKTPNVSVNTLFLYRNSNFHKENTDSINPDQERNGFNLQEAELQFRADVDPYTRMSLLLSIHPSYEVNASSTVEEKWHIEPEEGFVESNSISDVTVKIGKFKAAMGKHNLLHSHAFTFVDAPLANLNLLGDEGLNDVGASVAALLPTSWFSEVTLQYLRGEGENAEFSSPSPSDGVGLMHLKNFFDLSDALTMELGVSYAQGGNSLAGTTTLTGADLTFKWRPTSGGKYQSLMWVTEYLGRNQSQLNVQDEMGNGIATWLQYQFTERWTALYRHDHLTVENSFDSVNFPNDTWRRHSIGFVYRPSEFSFYKIEYDRRTGGLPSTSGETTDNTIYLQANFTIGAHPAHAY